MPSEEELDSIVDEEHAKKCSNTRTIPQMLHDACEAVHKAASISETCDPWGAPEFSTVAAL
eukprot:3976579-Amphidinium_carterae.1